MLEMAYSTAISFFGSLHYEPRVDRIGVFFFGYFLFAFLGYAAYAWYIRFQMNRMEKRLASLLFAEFQDERCAQLSGRASK